MRKNCKIRLYLFSKQDIDNVVYLNNNQSFHFKSVLQHNKFGAPFFQKPYSNLNISVTHKDHLFLIALSERFKVGIDMEHTSFDSHLIKYLAESEQNLINYANIEPACIWSMKEACSKIIGIGLKFGIRSIQIMHVTESTINFHFYANKHFDFIVNYERYALNDLIIILVYNLKEIN